MFTSNYTSRAIINRDDTFGQKIAEDCDAAVVTYGRSDATDVAVGATGSMFSWRGARIWCTVGGDFNVLNALAAATTAAEIGIPIGDIAAGLGNLAQIPGRFENVNATGNFAVLVDYAHTPEALRNVIAAARAVTDQRVIVVFGCGGDRDATKRPDMGAAAISADSVIVTSDNPRHEDPRAIIDAIVAGVAPTHLHKVAVEVDRRQAIAMACAQAGSGDVVIIAGRGHETVQSIAGRDIAFSDAQVARELLGAGS